MTIGEDRNKDRFKNWQLCSVWKLPFCDHRAIKLTQNYVCFTNPCINLLVPSSVTHENHHWSLKTCCSVLPLPCNVHCLEFMERHNTYLGLFSADVYSCLFARSRKSIKCKLKALFRRCKQYQIVRKKQMILQLPTVTRGVVTAYTLGVQHQRWTVVI